VTGFVSEPSTPRGEVHYHGLKGEGLVEVEGEPHRLRAGVSLFIPADARHRTTNTGPGPLRFLFVFPTDSFEEVVYRFEE
jgi:quercetin dioxygenase-like cupin family protein